MRIIPVGILRAHQACRAECQHPLGKLAPEACRVHRLRLAAFPYHHSAAGRRRVQHGRLETYFWCPKDDALQVQPVAGCLNRVGTDGRGAPCLEGREQAALRGHRGAGRRVIDPAEQLGELGVGCPALDGKRALAGRGEHVVWLEDLADLVGAADPGKAGVGEHDRVELALPYLGQPGARVSPNGDAGDVGPQHHELRGAARRAGADARAGWQVSQLRAVARDQRVARVVTSRGGGEGDSWRGPGRQVLERVHGEVHLAAQKGFPQRAHEDPGAADLRHLLLAHVTEGGHPDEFYPAAGALSDQPGHLTRLRDGHRALATAQAQGFRVHWFPSMSRLGDSSSARVTASTVRGSRSKRTRSAAAYSSPSGDDASSFTRTVGACKSLSTTRRTVWAISSRARPLTPSSDSRPANLLSSASTTVAAFARRATTVGVTRAARAAEP